MIGFMVRGLTLEGASLGLDYLFKPDFSILLSPKVWVSALCAGLLLRDPGRGRDDRLFQLSSQEIRHSEQCLHDGAGQTPALTSSPASPCSARCGFVAHSHGRRNSPKWPRAAPASPFVAFPMAISQMPVAKSLIGVPVFLLPVHRRAVLQHLQCWNPSVARPSGQVRHLPANASSPSSPMLGCSAVRPLYTTGAGVLILDIVDHFVGNYGIATCGLLEAFVIGWFYNALQNARRGSMPTPTSRSASGGNTASNT